MSTPPRPRAAALLAAVAAVTALSACTAASDPGPATTETVVRTSTAPPTTRSPDVPKPFALAAVDVPAQPPGSALPAGETEQTCPYIKAGLNIEPETTGKNFADIEGNRVARVTVLSTLQPVGCRFYFINDFHPTGDILPSTYTSTAQAYNAMVVTAEAGTGAQGVPKFVPGVDGISFRTHLDAADNGQDWAFAFAKGKVMVVVRTDQDDVSTNARLIAEAIVDQF